MSSSEDEVPAVLVDSREPLELTYELGKLVPVKRVELEVADFRVGTGDHCVVIERKTASDFLASVYQGRLFDQLYRMKDANAKPILAIIGEPSKKKWVRYGRKAFSRDLSREEMDARMRTYIANLAVAIQSYGVSVLQFNTEKDFMYFIECLWLKLTCKKTSLMACKPKGHTLYSIKFNIYSSLPGVGQVTADKLARTVSIKEFFSTPLPELSEKVASILPRPRLEKILDAIKE